MGRRRVSAALPDFPWDTIAGARATAAAHPDGLIDLSVGTPVDAVDPLIRDALSAASGFPGYPTTIGTRELRDAAADALVRRHGTVSLGDGQILPVIGTKEAIAGICSTLGLGGGDLVVIPQVAYPTYEVSAILAGAQPVRADESGTVPGSAPTLVFLNSPSNPTGAVMGVELMRAAVAWARERGAIVVSDECYLGLAWEAEPVSVLDPRVCDGDVTGLIAVHSLSKTSNLASYRAGFLAGDADLVAELLTVRKHSGLMVPFPVQAAMTAALTDDRHVDEQAQRYRARREVLKPAVVAAGLRVDDSQAGLYLWATRDEDARVTHHWLAQRGILTAPGDFYGPAGATHVRIALTASDEQIGDAARRLAG
ncbi:MAG TPA: succinyldiaminopimelate transaminase [Gordonia sp. (in: high G+C Gram-positive bacteria)]|uniref:succinyldiaminopimelate transaminase n=1 Tax=unclassified Gordonia (in: high G+C Gram-positive bacteria) TaxID=2657482 RepID=UPI0025BC5C69|nr:MULTISPECIES: succinyldiaminopimelate transaminase [unclassified Gordonia (in: high G+C Gram-positive bacteria)]HNP58636.1 succinyldiaminopimelate transaminase [Gordonia sp. (in: high G+C Gram-positive bacteria)]HRC52649.1 succinyldiaminopimelate transaminase [Gordonia sp. (in: high G+C Gram-positive bacteria)]